MSNIAIYTNMKIELSFSPLLDGFTGPSINLGKFRTKKAAYQYVKANRKSFGKGYFDLFIEKKCDIYVEPVREQDILNL